MNALGFTGGFPCLLLSYIIFLLGTLVFGVALAHRNEDLNEASWDGGSLGSVFTPAGHNLLEDPSSLENLPIASFLDCYLKIFGGVNGRKSNRVTPVLKKPQEIIILGRSLWGQQFCCDRDQQLLRLSMPWTCFLAPASGRRKLRRFCSASFVIKGPFYRPFKTGIWWKLWHWKVQLFGHRCWENPTIAWSFPATKAPDAARVIQWLLRKLRLDTGSSSTSTEWLLDLQRMLGFYRKLLASCWQ